MPPIPTDARLYLRPHGYADSPIGLDGQTARIGQSLLWFTAWEILWQGGKALVPVADMDAMLASLTDAQRAQADSMMAGYRTSRPPLILGERTIRLETPQVMGILNMTPDSFSDGGKHLGDPSAAADAGFAMHAAGAAIIDVGGESTRPGADPVWEGDEIARVVPVIERLTRAGVPVSIDTRKAAVMEAALAAGAHVINDVSALIHDPRSMEVVAAATCPVILMHAPSAADHDLHGKDVRYSDVTMNVYDWLEDRVGACVAAGIARDRIMVDPGIGFGKSVQENLMLVNRLALFQGLGLSLLFGASRKRMIGALSNEAPAMERLGGSVALALRAVEQGAQMVRVHDVPETIQAIRIWRGLRDAALTAG